jgi:hypothetical protein
MTGISRRKMYQQEETSKVFLHPPPPWKEKVSFGLLNQAYQKGPSCQYPKRHCETYLFGDYLAHREGQESGGRIQKPRSRNRVWVSLRPTPCTLGPIPFNTLPIPVGHPEIGRIGLAWLEEDHQGAWIYERFVIQGYEGSLWTVQRFI